MLFFSDLFACVSSLSLNTGPLLTTAVTRGTLPTSGLPNFTPGHVQKCAITDFFLALLQNELELFLSSVFSIFYLKHVCDCDV